MEENFMHTDSLTPGERMIYDDLYVIRDKSKESLKQFRKDFNIHKTVVKRLEKKYGITIGIAHGEKESAEYSISLALNRVKGKYKAIKSYLEDYKRGQKQFTKALYDFPSDTKMIGGKLEEQLMGLTIRINNVDRSISRSRDELRIANNYLKEATDREAKDKK